MPHKRITVRAIINAVGVPVALVTLFAIFWNSNDILLLFLTGRITLSF
jgi:hypothetical protein